MKKNIILLAVLLLVSLFFYFREDDEIKPEKPVLRIGVECDYVPNNWEEKRNSSSNFPISNHEGFFADGYDLQIAKIIADRLKRELVVKKIAWDDLIPALKRGEIDAIFSGMLDTEERKKEVSFSDTYEINKTEYAVLVNTDTPYANASKLTDFSGAKFTGQKNTKLYSSINQLPGAVALPAVDTVSEMLDAVTSGRADAIIINLDTGRSYEAAHHNLKVVHFPEGEGFVVGFHGICAAVRQNDKALLLSINEALDGIKKSERQRIMDTTVGRLYKNL